MIKRKQFSTNEMVIRYNYLTKAIEDSTKQAHAEGRFTWTDKETKEINSMLNEAENLRQRIRAIERGKNN